MISKRIGKWCWALSAEERATAAAVAVAQADKAPFDALLKRRHEAMLEKQKKLLARWPETARIGRPRHDIGQRGTDQP